MIIIRIIKWIISFIMKHKRGALIGAAGFGGAGAGIGLFKAHKAKKINRRALEIKNAALERYELTNQKTQDVLAELGKVEKEVIDSFGYFADTIEKIRKAHENYKPKRAYDVSKKVYGYDLLTKTIIESESIAEASHKSGADYRSIGQICNNKDYKHGGRFICAKRWLFSFDKEDLIDRVYWFFSDERIEFKKHSKGRKHG